MRLFLSYLTDLTQPAPGLLKYGVPRGCVLGPLLFLLSMGRLNLFSDRQKSRCYQWHVTSNPTWTSQDQSHPTLPLGFRNHKAHVCFRLSGLILDDLPNCSRTHQLTHSHECCSCWVWVWRGWRWKVLWATSRPCYTPFSPSSSFQSELALIEKWPQCACVVFTASPTTHTWFIYWLLTTRHAVFSILFSHQTREMWQSLLLLWTHRLELSASFFPNCVEQFEAFESGLKRHHFKEISFIIKLFCSPLSSSFSSLLFCHGVFRLLTCFLVCLSVCLLFFMNSALSSPSLGGKYILQS